MNLLRTDIKKTGKLFSLICQKSLAPIRKITVSEWAAKHRVLSTDDSAEPGKWNNNRAPYQVEIMNSFTQPGIHKSVLMLAAQTGKSTLINNAIGRFAQIDPGPIMLVQPTIEMAEDYSKSRIAPMIRDTASLKRIFHDVKSRNTNNTILSKLFPGGRLIMCGANSPTGLASRPIRNLFFDEVDRYCDSSGTEGDPVDLATKRTTTFWNSLVVLTSTPGDAANSRIAAEYAIGSQEEWQHKCPNCDEYSLIKWENMEVDYTESQGENGKKIIFVKDVSWHCPQCGFGFKEQTMREQPQKFIAQAPEAVKNGIRSFFVNGFSSPWISWKIIAQEYLESKGDPEREKVVVNTRFAEPYRLKGDFADESIFLKRREFYGAEVPNGVLLLTAAVDTQDNRLEYEICGWSEGEECWGIKKGIILGVPDTPEVWKQLDVILDKEYTHANGRKMLVARTFIDSGGHYTKEVYAYCLKNKHKQRFAIKGMNLSGVPLIYKMGVAKNYNVSLVLLGVDQGKQYVMERLAIENVGPKYFHYPLPVEGEQPQGYDEIYFKGLIAEKLIPKSKNGKIVMCWTNIAEDHRNEPLDLRVYNMAVLHSIPVNWEKMKELMDSANTVQNARQKVKKKAKVSYGSSTQKII